LPIASTFARRGGYLPGDRRFAPKQRQGARRSYAFTGNISRIGKTVTIDVTIAPVEEPGNGRTVIVSGALENPSALTPGDLALFRRLGAEAALKAKTVFFGDERVGEGASAKYIPRLSGTITRSAPLPGDMVSTALSDTDLDGKMELVAAYPDAMAVYRVQGDELREKARIPAAGPGLFHVDAADVTRNGVADIVAVRYAGGKALSDIWQFDGRSTGRYPLTCRISCARPTSARKGSSSSGRRPTP